MATMVLAFGVDYDEDTGKFTLAEGYIADENGWVVERDAVTGPTPIK